MPGMGVASPSISLSTPAIILSRVDLPEPFKPNIPILAPGKKLREISFKIWRLGGTILPTRFMVKTYWAMGCVLSGSKAIKRRLSPHPRSMPQYNPLPPPVAATSALLLEQASNVFLVCRPYRSPVNIADLDWVALGPSGLVPCARTRAPYHEL